MPTANTYTPDEIRQLKVRLYRHRDNLCQKISALCRECEEDSLARSVLSAASIRDASQLLIITCSTLGAIDSTIERAKRRGKCGVPQLEECGLEEETSHAR